MAGEKMCHIVPYGYLKDPQDQKKWVVDEAAAKVVEKVFRWCLAGLGPTHIARKLRDMQIPTPTTHFAQMGLKTTHQLPAIPYDWEVGTIRNILSRSEYLGHTVNFKTTKKSYKSKTILYNAPEDYVVFENTHPAIIDQETFDRVQQLRSGKRRRASSGRVELFSGVVYCADCGSRLYFASGASRTKEQDHYVCSGFRNKRVKCCHSHYIRVVVLKQMVLDYLQQITVFASKHEKAFAHYLMRNVESKNLQELSIQKRQLTKMQRRITELDSIIQRLYEDSVLGKLTHERFVKLSQGYEQEQADLESKIRNLSKQVNEQEQQTANAEQFLRLIRNRTNITELTPTILHELIERIEVHAPDKSSGKRMQEITIHLSFIGEIGKLDILDPETADLADIEKG